MRKIIAVMSVVVMVMLVSIKSYAAENTVYTPSLSFNGTTATCKLMVVASNMSHSIEATVTLKHGSSVIAHWDNLTAMGVMNFSDNATVVHGYTYTLQITLKINGVSYSVPDITKTCP